MPVTKEQQNLRHNLYNNAVKYQMFDGPTPSESEFNNRFHNDPAYAAKVYNNYKHYGIDLGKGKGVNGFKERYGYPYAREIIERRYGKKNDYGGRALAEGAKQTAGRLTGEDIPDTSPEVPYRQSQMPNMIGPSEKENQTYRRAGQQAAQQAQQEYNRRTTPMVRDSKGNPVTGSKTEGQYEDEQAAILQKELQSTSQSIADEIAAQREQQGLESFQDKGNPFSSAGSLLSSTQRYNEITNPDALWKALDNDNVRKKVADSFVSYYDDNNKPVYTDTVLNGARQRGISPEQYIQQYGMPAVANSIAQAFENSLNKQYSVKNYADYLARKFGDSFIGTIGAVGANTDRTQRQRLEQGTQQYEKNLSGWGKAGGTVANLAAQGLEMAATGAGGGALVKGGAKLLGSVVSRVAPRMGAMIASGGNSMLTSASENIAQKLGRYAMQFGYGTANGVAGMSSFMAVDAMRREMSTGDDPDFASVIKAGWEGAKEGAKTGLIFGAAGLPGRGLTYAAGKVANTVKRTAAMATAKTFSVATEAGVMTWQEYNDWRKQPHKEGENFDLSSSIIKSLAMVATFKGQHLVQQYFPSLAKRLDEYNKANPNHKVNAFQMMGADFVNMFTGKSQSPVKLSDKDKQTVEKATGKTIEELGSSPENLMSVFNNSQIPWTLRQKISLGTTHAMDVTRPRTQNWNLTLDENGNKLLNEYDKDGNLIEQHPFTTMDEHDAILGKVMMRRDNDDMLNFLGMYRMGLYKGAVYNHAQNEAIFKDTVTEMGYDYDRMRVDKKYNQQVTDELNGTKNREYQDLYKKKIMEAPTRDEEVVSQFAKDNGMKDEDVLKIIQKDPLDRTDDEQSLMDDLRQTLHDDLFQQGELHINQSTQDGADSADRIRLDDFNTYSERWGYYSKLVADNTKNWNDAFNSIKGLKEVVDSAGKDATPDKVVDAIQSSETLSDADKAKAIATFSDLNNAKALQNGFFSQAYNRINTEVGREFIEHIPTQGSKIFDSEGNPLKFQVLSVTTGEANIDGTPKVYTIKSSTGLNFREDGTVDPNGDPHASVVLQDPFGNTKVVSAHDPSLKLIGTESTDEFTARRTQQIQVGLSQAFASKEVKREPAAGSEEAPTGTENTSEEVSTETPTNGVPPTDGSVGSGSATASQDIPLSTRVSEYDKQNGTELGRFISYLDNGKQLPEGENRHFKVGHTGDLLNSLGIKGDIAVSTTTVGNRHTKNEAHNLSSQDWFDVINDLNTPLAITKYGDGYRIYTHVHIDGDKAICAGVEVRKVGHGLDITNIKTAFGRDLSKILWNEDVLYPTDINKLKQAIAEFSSSDNSRIYPPQPEGKDSEFSVIEDTDGVKKIKMPSGKLIRVNSEGYPYYTEADPSDAAAELIHRYADDPDRVDRKVDVKIKNAQKALDKAEKAKPSEAEDDAQFDREEDARKKAIDDAKSNLDHWNKIKNEVAKQRAAKVEAEKAEQDRQTAFNALQNIYKQATDMGLSVDGVESLLNDKNATTDQLNTMRRAVEDAIKKEQERIDAQRGLEGVPTIDKDTPKDARSRGFRNDNGTRIDRQTETKGVVGRESVARFSYKPEDEKKGHLKLIDASELQPSHLAGVRNPHFFIDEAQPKDRTDAESITKEQTHAKGIRPELITKDGNAYAETAPVVNTRGEVIQGNHRSAVLKTMYDGGYTESIEKYKQYLKDHAEEFGIKPEDVDKMKNPVLVNEIDVNDKEAIRLGQMTSRDLESGGIRDINPSVTATKLLTTDGKFNMENFVSLLLRTQDPDASISQLIVNNGADVIKLMAKNNIISDTEAVSAIDKETGRLTPEAKAALKDILLSMLFKNGKSDLPKIFDSLPIRVQNAIATTFARDFQSPESERIIGYLQQAIDLLYNARQDANFAKTTTHEDAKGAMSTWLKGQDAFSQKYNAEGYGNAPVELATRMQVMKQTEISAMLDRIFDKVQARTKTGQGEMKFDEKGNPIKEEPKPMPLSQALKEELGIGNITKQVHFKDPQIKKETTKQIAEGLQKKGIVVHMTTQEGQDKLDSSTKGAIKAMRVYHGSANDFDHFDTMNHLSEGEGSQVFGAGTYVADQKELGKKYAEIASSGTADIIIDGKREDAFDHMGSGDGVYSARDALYYADGNKQKALEYLQKKLDYYSKHFSDSKVINEYQNAISLIKNDRAEYADHRKILYDVEIPDDNGKNYLDWDEPFEGSKKIADKLYNQILAEDKDGMYSTPQAKEGLRKEVDEYLNSYRLYHVGDVYGSVSSFLGSDKKASEFFRNLGYVGFKVHAAHNSGDERYSKNWNYVVFDDKDLKIINKYKYFKTSKGEVYGFVDLKTGEIYLDPQHMDPNLTIHEYGHLWAAAVKTKDPKRWQSIVDRVNEAAEGKLKPLFDEVRKADPDLKGDDLAEEVLMRYSGTKGMKLLDEEAKKIWDSGKTVDEKQVAKGAIEKVVENLKNTIREFWKDVADMLGIKYRNVDDIADHIIHDALTAKNPRDLRDVEDKKEKAIKEKEGLNKNQPEGGIENRMAMSGEFGEGDGPLIKSSFASGDHRSYSRAGYKDSEGNVRTENLEGTDIYNTTYSRNGEKHNASMIVFSSKDHLPGRRGQGGITITTWRPLTDFEKQKVKELFSNNDFLQKNFHDKGGFAHWDDIAKAIDDIMHQPDYEEKTEDKHEGSGKTEPDIFFGANTNKIFAKTSDKQVDESAFKGYKIDDTKAEFEPTDLERIKSLNGLENAVIVKGGTFKDAKSMEVVSRGIAELRTDEASGKKYWVITKPAEVKLVGEETGYTPKYPWHTIVGPYATTIEATPDLVKSAEENWSKAKELLDKTPNMSQPQLQREMKIGFKVASLIYDRWKNEKKPGKKMSLSDVLKEKGNLSPEEKAKVEKEYYEQRSSDLYEIEREKSGYTGDYAQVLKDNDTWRGAVKALRDKAADYRKQADDWRNRKYKDGKGSVTTEDINGDQHTTSFNAINEKRRQNNIKNLEQSAKECEDMANELVKRVQAEKLVEPGKPKSISDLTEEEEATFTPEQKEKYKKAYEHIERRAGVLKERDIKTKLSEYEYYLNHATDKAKALTYKHGIAIYKAELKKREEYGEKYGIKIGKVSLDHLSEIFHKFNSDDSLTPVFERVLAVCKQFNPEIKFTKALGYGTGGNAGSDGIIKYNIEYLLRSNVKDQEKASTLLHEMVHNATLYALEAYDRRDSTRRGRNGLSGKDTWNKLTKGQQKAVEEIYNIYEQIKGDRKDFPGQFDKNGKFIQNAERRQKEGQQYGLTNVYEMVAEIYSNGEFREQAKKKNLWGRLKDAIVNFFTSNVVGSTKTDVMQALKERIDYLLEHPNKEAYEAARGYWRPRKSDKVPVEDHKEKQLDIIKRTNPMEDDYHVGIRSTEDINTFKEAVDNARNDDDLAGSLSSYPDVTNDMIERALKDGKITVYSSKPIKEGSFITPSKMQAEDYAGGRGKQVFSKEIPVDDAAWVNTDEGQYAPVHDSKTSSDKIYSGESSDYHDILLSLRNEGETKKEDNGKEAGEEDRQGAGRSVHSSESSKQSVDGVLRNRPEGGEVGQSDRGRILRSSREREREEIEKKGNAYLKEYGYLAGHVKKSYEKIDSSKLAFKAAQYTLKYRQDTAKGNESAAESDAIIVTLINQELKRRNENISSSNLNIKSGENDRANLYKLFKEKVKDPALNSLFDKVSAIADRLNLKIEGEDRITTPSGGIGLGYQDANTGKITLNKTFFNSEYIPDQIKMESLLHEMIHTATRYALEISRNEKMFAQKGITLSDGMKEAVKEINEVYEAISKDPVLRQSYGITDTRELLAEAGSNLGFREKLKSIGLWTKIINGIKHFFGIETNGASKDNALNVLDGKLNYIIDNFDENAYNAATSKEEKAFLEAQHPSVAYDAAQQRRQEQDIPEVPLHSKSIEEQSEDINTKVADGGFNKVLGHEGFNNLMRDIYLHVRPQSMRDYVRENMWQNNLNVYKTLGQYLAEQATKPGNLYLWSEVNARLNHAIDAAGYSIELGMRQTKYLSWLAQHPQDIANPLKEAERISVYNKIMSEPYSQPVQHGEFQDIKDNSQNNTEPKGRVSSDNIAAPQEPQDPIAPPVHSLTDTDVKSVVHNDQAQQQFADPAKPTLPPTSTPVQHFAKAMYNKGLAHWFYVWKEAHIDRTQAAQLLVRSILGVKKKLGLIQGSMKGLLKEDEDFLSGMNQLGSKAKAQGEVFEQTIAKPLNKVIHSILPEFGKSTAMGNMTELQNYMYDKSGLERNRVFFVRDIHHKWLKNADKADRAVEKAEEFKKKADKMLVSAIKSKDNDQINAATLVVKKADTELKRAQQRAAKVRKDANDVYKDFLDFKNNDLTPKLKSGKITLKEYYHQLDDYIRGLKGYDKYVAGEHDYSGLSSHYGDKKTYDDDKVIDAVMNIENNIGADRINSLWDATNVATRYGIGVERKAGLIGKDLYDHLNSMFSWYVPMRGFEENMAEDIYTYLNAPYNSSSKPKSALQKALGRKSHGDVDIFAEIGAMTARSIFNAEQNSMVNQRFATFIRNHYNVDGEDRLVSEIKPWAVKKIDPQGNEVWEEAFPQLDEIIGKDKQGNPIFGESLTNADEITKRIKDFNAQMEQLQAQGTAKVLDDDDTIPYEFISKAHRSAHIVPAYFDGKEHLFIVNGNPRAAQAINGELEPHNWFGSGIVHGMSQLMTTYSVDFLGSNLSRDATYAGANIYINEGVDYYRRYFGNYHKIWSSFAGVFSKGIKNKASAGSLIYRYNHGTLNLNNTDDRLFKEYMDNGGETGWTSMENVDKWKQKIRKAFQSKTKENTMAVINALPHAVEFANQHAENLARFAVYMTSRKMGRSITRSIADAKEVSVNFQRKGAGWKTKDFKYEGEGKAGQVNTFLAATSSQLARSYLAFYNAGIQGLNSWVKNNVEHPGRTTLVTSIALAGGIFVPFLNKILQNFFDSDEDKKGIPSDPYAELPETTRRQNLCIYVGGGDFLTIPLGIEVRASYGIGDIMAGLTTNPELKSDNVPNDIASQITQILPVDFLGEGYTNPLMTLTPTAIRPVLEGGLPSVIVGEGNASEGENQKWNGLPLRRDRTDYNKDQPAWMRAFASTGGAYMWFAKTLDKATNDLNSPNVKGSIDVDPAQLENYTKGFFGGIGQVTSEIGNLKRDVQKADKEGNLSAGTVLGSSNMPILRRFHYKPTEQNRYYRTRTRWFHYRDEAQQFDTDMKGLEKDGHANPIEYAKTKAPRYRAMEERRNIFKQAMKEYNNYSKLMAIDPNTADAYSLQRDMLMQNTVQQLDKIK